MARFTLDLVNQERLAMNNPVIQCRSDRNLKSKWTIYNVAVWQLVGGEPYRKAYRDLWVITYRNLIASLAKEFKMPKELLAGVSWIEVSGDPHAIDRIAFEVRSLRLPIVQRYDNRPATKTSFGAVSMQLEVAARTLGLDPGKMSQSQLRQLAQCLQQDTYNLRLVALHLRDLINYDGLQTSPPSLTMEAARIAGDRYNRGIKPSLEQIKTQPSYYGAVIIKNWPRLTRLLK